MWESPITMITENIARDIISKTDEALVEYVHTVGFDVDKEELAKALAYDRHQYEWGYADGRADRDAEIVRCKECKYAVDFDGRIGCEWHGFYSVAPDWFCADGERRTDDDRN